MRVLSVLGRLWQAPGLLSTVTSRLHADPFQAWPDAVDWPARQDAPHLGDTLFFNENYDVRLDAGVHHRARQPLARDDAAAALRQAIISHAACSTLALLPATHSLSAWAPSPTPAPPPRHVQSAWSSPSCMQAPPTTPTQPPTNNFPHLQHAVPAHQSTACSALKSGRGLGAGNHHGLRVQPQLQGDLLHQARARQAGGLLGSRRPSRRPAPHTGWRRSPSLQRARAQPAWPALAFRTHSTSWRLTQLSCRFTR